MRNNHVNLLNDSGMVQIQGVRLPFVSGSDYLSVAVVKFDTVIPPRSTKVLSVTANAVRKRIPFKIVSLPEPHHGLFVQSTPSFENGNCIAVSRNNLNCYVNLKRNTPIGYAVRVKPIIIAENRSQSSPSDSLPRTRVTISSERKKRSRGH